jgi:hypothetical protein
MRSVACSLASAVLVLAGCAGETKTETRVVTVRETVEVPALLPQPGLPTAVAEKREAVWRAANEGDYDEIERLVDPNEFEYTFGGPVEGGPVAYWRRLEETTDERPLDVLRKILEMPFATERGIYVWPSPSARI